MLVAFDPCKTKPAGVFIHALTETTRMPESAGERDDGSSQPVRQRRHAVPSVDADPQKDRLGEEGKPFQPEPQADDRAGELHEVWPEQPQLERQHRPRDRPHRKEDRRSSRLSPGKNAIDRILRSQPERFGHGHHERESNSDHREEDVKTQRDRHLQPGGKQVRHEHPNE